MKLYLFWWAELDRDHHIPQLKLIEKIIHEIWPKQVLHIPFARSPETEQAWGDNWFIKDVNLGAIEYLNAKNEIDIDKANNPLIIITWWWNNLYLLEKINSNPKLLSLVLNTEYLIWESAWSMVLGTNLRVRNTQWKTIIVPGLWIIKDTIIEPHYTERNRQKLLGEEMNNLWLSFGIWIDCITAMCFDLKDFPNKYTTIGNGLVEVKSKKAKIILVNQDDEIIGYKYRWTLEKEDRYRVSALWITNSRWDILLAKRHHTKKHHPMKWWPAVAGTVDEGETYKDNIIKEAEEELWLSYIQPILGPKVTNQEDYFHFTQRYTFCCDKDISEFVIQENEVEEIAWFSPKQLEQDFKKNPDEFLPNFETYYQLFTK